MKHSYIFLFSILLAILCVFYSYKKMEFRTDRADLVDDRYEFHQRWLTYAKNFNLTDDIIVVTKSTEEGDRIAAIEELANILSKEKDFKELFYKIDKSSFSDNKAFFYADKKEIQKTRDQLQKLENAKSVKDLYEIYPEHADLLTETISSYVNGEKYKSPWEKLISLPKKRDSQTEYISVSNLSFLQIRATSVDNEFDPTARSVKKIRDIINQIKENHPNVKFGLTGLPVLESDEMSSAQKTNVESTIISFVGIIVLFFLGFGKIRNPSIVVFSLVLSICYAFGAITLLIGHLNILSMFFVSMIIGLGIDYGIYIISVYDHYVSDLGMNKLDAIKRTMDKVRLSIIAGALTSSVGFASTYFSPFLGLKELGYTASIGILVCLVSTILFLPSTLAIFADEKRTNLNYNFKVYNWIKDRQRALFIVCAIMISSLCFTLSGVDYSRNLLHLQPDTEAVYLERYISEKTGMSAWYAVSLCDSVEECEKRKEIFQKLPSVAKVESITSLLPTEQDEKAVMLNSIKSSTDILANKEPRRIEPSEIYDYLNNNLKIKLARRMSNKPHYIKFYEIQVILFKDLAERSKRIKEKISIDKVEINNLPTTVTSRFVGEDGKMAIHIYCKDNLWIFNNLEKFVRELRQFDPDVTGHPVGYYEATLQMEESYKGIITWGIVGIILIILLSLRNIAFTFVAMIPLVIGIIFTLTICKLLGIHLNTANIIAFPIILGTGIDNGIHMIGEYFKGYKSVPTYATARGVFFSCTTTMVGFGALLISSHKGLVGLGKIVTIGMFGCLIGSLMLAYILNMIREREK